MDLTYSITVLLLSLVKERSLQILWQIEDYQEFYPLSRGFSCEKDMSFNQFTDVTLIYPILK